MTEFHARYGGYGVMIYWHVERGRLCVYSQLKSCSSSEVAAMIEGLLRHGTAPTRRSRPTTPTPTALLLHGHLLSRLPHWHQDAISRPGIGRAGSGGVCAGTAAAR